MYIFELSIERSFACHIHMAMLLGHQAIYFVFQQQRNKHSFIIISRGRNNIKN